MEKLKFERRKYGKELLIDACDETELNINNETMTLSFYTLVLIKQGQGTYYLDSEKISVQPNMVLFVKPAQINQVKEVHFEKCYLLFFEKDFLDDFFNDKNLILKFGFFQHTQLPHYLLLPEVVFDRYYTIAQEIRSEIKALTLDSVHILRSLIYYLLVRLNQEYGKQYSQNTTALADPIILHFLQLIQADIKQNNRVAQVAEKIGVSRVYLNSLCQKYFSKTANQIIREQLIAEIKKEIVYSQKDFAQIAYDFHFSAPPHFSRFVKQMTGLSPQALKYSLSNW